MAVNNVHAQAFLIEVEKYLLDEHAYKCKKNTVKLVEDLMNDLNLDISYTKPFGYCITITMNNMFIQKLKKTFNNDIPWQEIDIIIREFMFRILSSLSYNLSSFSSTFSAKEFANNVLISVKTIDSYGLLCRTYTSCFFKGNKYDILKKQRFAINIKSFFKI